MVRVAGKPVVGHMLDKLTETAIDSVVIVVGPHKGTQIIEYVTAAYGDQFTFSFPEQTVTRGLGHGIYQARDAVGDDSLFIMLGDMLFIDGYEPFLTAHRENGADATIGVYEVADPQHYGVVELADEWAIRRLVEKPADPPSNYAISGLYAIQNATTLFDTLGSFIDADQRGAGGEFQLTDALQRMVDTGSALAAQPVSNWYDCGRPEPLLDVNRVLLDRRELDPSVGENAVVIPPVDIGSDVIIESSVIGPYVSVDHGTEIRRSIVEDSIVGRNVRLSGMQIERSLIGDHADLEDDPDRMNIGSNSRLGH